MKPELLKSFLLATGTPYVSQTLHTLRTLEVGKNGRQRWVVREAYGSTDPQDEDFVFEEVRIDALETARDTECHAAVFHGRRKILEYGPGAQQWGNCDRCGKRSVLFDDNEDGWFCPKCHAEVVPQEKW